jgi:hypothetical protein
MDIIKKYKVEIIIGIIGGILFNIVWILLF